MCLPSVMFLLVMFFSSEVCAANDKKEVYCPMVKIETERLPDMNIARSGHSLLYVNGELTAIGGHTTGFKPTPTAEYFDGKKWHTMPMTYTHDDGTALVLRSKKVLIMGGHEKNLGIGQSYEVEIYDPKNHRFTGIGCLDRKRTLFSALEIDSGRVVIAGNWYNDDDIEMSYIEGARYEAKSVKPSSQMRVNPFILRTSADNVFIVGQLNTCGEFFDTIVVDQLHGDPLHIPLFDTWKPANSISPYAIGDCFIGDETKGDYRSLIPVVNKEGQMAIALLTDTVFTILPTSPSFISRYGVRGTRCGERGARNVIEERGEKIEFFSSIIVDRQAQRAYLIGEGSRVYVLCIDYSRSPAPLTLYYTDPLPVSSCVYTLDGQGDLIISGGMEESNFSPSATVYRLPVGGIRGVGDCKSPPTSEERGVRGEGEAGIAWYFWVLGAGCFVLAVGCWLLIRRSRNTPDMGFIEERGERSGERGGSNNHTPATDANNELMDNICALMEAEQLYLNAELKLTDVARRVGSNRNAVSACINRERNCSFTQFVNEYRVKHAQEIIRKHPDIKVSEICYSSGFSNETTFFRTFRSVTGMTPMEWKSTHK